MTMTDLGALIANTDIDIPAIVESVEHECRRPGCNRPRATRSRYCCPSCRLCAGTARQRARKRAAAAPARSSP